MARQGAEFGKRIWRATPRKSDAPERQSSSGMWLIVLAAAFAFACVFAAQRYLPFLF
jgi:hypothetical protein